MLQTLFHGVGQDATGFLRAALAFFVVLGVLVCVHELGHYLAARWRGVQVEVFSIGFGRAIVTWHDKVGTEWKIGWIPLGGYVRLHGQERPDTVSPETRALWIPGKTFHDKHVFSRILVVIAGPLANLALAIVLFSLLFAIVGMPVTRPEVSEIKAGGAAAQAGLVTGDRIESIGDRKIDSFADVKAVVSRHPGALEIFHIVRNGAKITLPVTLGTQQDGGRQIGMLGITAANDGTKKLGPVDAVVNAFEQTGDIISQTLLGIWSMVTTQQGTEELGGPLRIAQLSGQFAQLGVAKLVAFIAVLSINLGLVNLFPIPLLDGGHLVFYGLEIVSGRMVSLKAQNYAQRFGILLLGAVFVFATWNDLRRLQIGHWFARFF